MSTSTWLDDNQRYLAASLQWLRLRLQQMAPAAAPASPAPAAAVMVVAAPAPAAQRSWFGQKPGAASVAPAATTSTVLEAPPPNSARSDLQALAQAAAEREAAAQVDPPPALLLLAQRFGMSPFERDTLLLCAAAELDPEIGALFAAAQGQASRSIPTFALAMRALDEPAWDALSPQRPLRHMHFIEISQPGATPLTASALRIDERILNYLKGLNLIDERLLALVVEPAPSAQPLSHSQQAVADGVLQHLRRAAGTEALPVIQLLGADGASKLAVAGEVCAAVERRLYRLPLASLPAQRAEIENLARLWQRESALLPVALYLDADPLDGASAETVAAFHAFVARELGLLFIGVRDAPAQTATASHAVEVRKPTPAEQHDAWRGALPSAWPADEAGRCARLLAGQFDLGLSDIRQAAAPTGEPATDLNTVWDRCRALTRPRLDALAQRIEPKATWDDLVLADESMQLLRQIVAQVRGRYQVFQDWGYANKMTRGLGLSALFAGESGTGKTMAAEVVANELRLHLYRIDLSAVVSKYIGETEKNLRRLFDAAEQGGAILFFDEADALFGKRSEVKDSHDRYANIEINYLLQRMEAFSGLAILATNMKSALDAAFMRRLRFVVRFPFPGPAERKLIWQKSWPPEVPREALDYDRLARTGVSGGNVHSIALNAAFMAAQRGSAVTMPLLLSALRTELRKLDKPVNEAEWR
ncbi:MAG: ATP-binding protein [Burkholderiales bacterium]|nr:ATP-binding protein [Burkholderiales bacterium]